MIPWLESLSNLFGSQHRPDGYAAAQSFGQSHDVRHYPAPLVGKELSCPSHPHLNFVKNKQGAIRIAEFTSRLHKRFRNRVDPPFPLNRFNQNRCGIFIHFSL